MAVSVVGQEPKHFTSLSSTLQNYGDTQRLSCSKPVDETPVPSGRSPAGGVLSSQDDHDGRIPYGLGGSIKEASLWSLDRDTSWLAHKSVGATGSLPGSQTGCHVLVRTDNSTVVSYMNRQGRLHSRPLCRLARRVLLWAQTKFPSIRAVHVPGRLNSGADLLSRQSQEDGWVEIAPQVVSLIWQRFGLFASSMTTHCPLWFSLSPPLPLGLDALAHEWPKTNLYAFPPIRLLPVVLFRVRSDKVEHLLLVAPWWPTQSWFSDLVSVLACPTCEVPLGQDLLTQARGMIWHSRLELWRLLVWPLSGVR